MMSKYLIIAYSTSITINGNVEVGENSFIGSGSVIIQSTKVKKFINTNV